MTITIEPETENQLRNVANREGQDVSILANALLAQVLEQKAHEFAAEVAAIQEGFEAARNGRERPFEEFLSEHQSRYRATTNP